jgi:fucose 4-O-acetylase-like acetyltransferase
MTNKQQIFSSERIAMFDALKGFAILLMILANHVDGIVYLLIYSFLIPLFVFISGYFYREKGIKEAFIYDLKRLLIPYFLVCGVLVLLDLHAAYFSTKDFLIPVTRIVSYALGVTKDTENLYYVGPVWFLFCLFWCRTLYNIITKRINIIIAQNLIFVISILTVLFREKVGFIPFCLMQGLNIMLLYSAGYFVRDFGLLDRRITINTVIITCLMAFIVVKFGGLDVLNCDYKLYPIEIINASFICLLLYKVFLLSETKIPFVLKQLSIIGKHSLLILCVHTVVFLKLNGVLNFIPDNVYLKGFVDVLISLVIAYLLLMIKKYNKNHKNHSRDYQQQKS